MMFLFGSDFNLMVDKLCVASEVKCTHVNYTASEGHFPSYESGMCPGFEEWWLYTVHKWF